MSLVCCALGKAPGRISLQATSKLTCILPVKSLHAALDGPEAAPAVILITVSVIGPPSTLLKA